MVDPLPNPDVPPQPAVPGGPLGPQPATPRPAEAAPGSTGVEFQSLLERIETHARELAQKSDEVSRPDELAGAVDSARTSLEEVLDLKERLLEAYRQQRQTGDGPAAGDGPNGGAAR